MVRAKQTVGESEMNKYTAGVKMLSIPDFNVDKGNTVVLEIEGKKDIPFEIKRIFYIFGKGNVGLVRGKHANRKSEFVLFNVSGQSKVKIVDEKNRETVYELKRPQEAIYLPRMVWKEMYDFTEDSVLMVLTNEYYDPEEYIRNFTEFVDEIEAEME